MGGLSYLQWEQKVTDFCFEGVLVEGVVEGGLEGGLEGGVGGKGQACAEGTQSVLFCSSSTASLICVHMYAMFTPAGISAEKETFSYQDLEIIKNYKFNNIKRLNFQSSKIRLKSKIARTIL